MAVVQAAPRAPAAAASAGTADAGRFRGDIQGLRAVAVLLVLGFHADVPWLSGGFVGVDVFFVISGFLITGLVVREIEATGRLDLRRFWARRVRRLLPATAVTLAAVAVITVVLLPVTRWASIVGDIVTSATYVVNWRLASNAVDYLASESAASPVQHFWSLAVEEQFYVVWPVLVLIIATLARRLGWTLRRALFAGVTVVGAASLGWSVLLTTADPGRAYFVSTTRVWELAIGAGLAIVAPRLVLLPRHVAAVLGWLGLVAIAYAGVTYDAATAFPGAAALVPTLGAAAVLAAGVVPTSAGAERLLSVSPMQDVGTLSYSLYLWHWPVLVAATAVWGRDDGTLWLPVAVMAVGFSAVPAWFTYRVVEAPIHHGRWFRSVPRAAALGVLCTAVGLAAALVVNVKEPDADSAPAPESLTGAAVLDSLDDPRDVLLDEATVTLDPVATLEDNAEVYADGCHQDQDGAELQSCVYGDAESDTVVALVGDSHAAQWQPAMAEIATDRGWRLETYTKSACGFVTADVAIGGKVYDSCTEWNTNLREHLTGSDAPDLVVASTSSGQRIIEDGTVLADGANADRLAEGMRESWETLENADVETAVIRDTPGRPVDMLECVAENLTSLTECASGLGDRYLAGVDAQAIEETDDVGWVEMTPFICPGDICPGVIGDVIVWRDKHHMSAAYARSLAPYLERELAEADLGEFDGAASG